MLVDYFGRITTVFFIPWIISFIGIGYLTKKFIFKRFEVGDKLILKGIISIFVIMPISSIVALIITLVIISPVLNFLL